MTSKDCNTASSGVVAAAVGGIVLLVFLRCVFCDFVDWDDRVYVCDNPIVLGGLSPTTLWRACTEAYFCNWAPLQIVSYLVDAAVFGMRPWGFHLTNIVIHAAGAGLLAHTLARFTGHVRRSVLAAMLWACHPMRVESVAWISDRKDVLAGFFLIVALGVYGRHARAPRLGTLLVVTAAMAASVLSKASTMILPVLLLLFDIWPLGRVESLRSQSGLTVDRQIVPARAYSPLVLVAEKLPLFAVGVAIAMVTMRTHTIDVSHPVLTTAVERFFIASFNLRWYLETTLWPAGLHPMHVSSETLAGLPAGVYAAAAVAAISIAASQQGRQAWLAAIPAVAIGVGWFLVALLPTIGLTTQVGASPYTDRYTYVPHIGLAIAAAWLGEEVINRVIRSRAWAIAIWAAVIGSWIFLDVRQIAVWRDSRSLAEAVLRVDPDNCIALTQAGGHARREGDLETAQKCFQRAVDVSAGGYPAAIVGLATIRMDAGHLQEAATILRWAARVQRDPSEASQLAALATQCEEKLGGVALVAKPAGSAVPQALAAMRAGMARVRVGDFKGAMAAFQNAVALDPEYAAAHNNLGMAAVELGDRRAALQSFQKAVECDASQADYAVNLARTYFLLKRFQEAFSAIETAASLAPGDPEIKALREDYRKRVGRP